MIRPRYFLWLFPWRVRRLAYLAIAVFSLGMCVGKSWSQPPWLVSPVPAQPPTGVGLPPPAAAAARDTVVKYRQKVIVKTDTLEVVKLKIDTVFAKPVNNKRKYKLQVCNLDYERVVSLNINLVSFDFYEDILGNLNGEDKMKNCYFSSAYGDTNYSYSYGMETVRSNGFIFDNYGNKLEQTEKVLTGITLNVRGDDVSFDYLENKKLMLKNTFHDGQVNFYADYTYFEYRCNFWIFCNNIQKKQYLFLNLTREEVFQ
jgi:hypothetical protein